MSPNTCHPCLRSAQRYAHNAHYSHRGVRLQRWVTAWQDDTRVEADGSRTYRAGAVPKRDTPTNAHSGGRTGSPIIPSSAAKRPYRLV
jgi:hypothetical protein